MDSERFAKSRTRPPCPWQGPARHDTVSVAGRINPDVARYYPPPAPLARTVRNHVALRNGVVVENVAGRASR
ncbi:DUF427 domain-containing protein [Streptomyces sp. 8K308]|nr:DUF427 domain-containing protein [Streptomyces sp. 8K308]